MSSNTSSTQKTPQHWLFSPIPSIMDWASQQVRSPLSATTILELRLFVLLPVNPRSTLGDPSNTLLLLLKPLSSNLWTIPTRAWTPGCSSTLPSSISAAALEMLQHAIEERQLLNPQFLDINLRVPCPPIMTFSQHQQQPPSTNRSPMAPATLRFDLAMSCSFATLDIDSIISPPLSSTLPPSSPMFSAIAWVAFPAIRPLLLDPKIETQHLQTLIHRLQSYTGLHTSIRTNSDLNSLLTLCRLAVLTKVATQAIAFGEAIPFALIGVRLNAEFAALWVIETDERVGVNVPPDQIPCIANPTPKVGGGGWVVDRYVIIGEVVQGRVNFGDIPATDVVTTRRLLGGMGNDARMRVGWIQRSKLTKIGAVPKKGRMEDRRQAVAEAVTEDKSG